ncbi:hypothetical protein [Altericroceibacterium endophyticum]|uniref:hypothetical protein n=1 Tax=Altericroceibacterium endophyticum TaxID=1808508 RepID=UPI001926A2D1|nr:hypothetical protein [Altericroceibacterium endophyticum]
MGKAIYHSSRIIFGLWWLYSGLMHFLVPGWQPMGQEPAAIAFTQALIDSGLFEWIKIIEVILGVTMLMNRWMPLTLIALTPINIVIIYWNFVLDYGVIEWVFGGLSVLFNIVLMWAWRAYYWPLLVFRGDADYSLNPKVPR